ncbi:hypothetical protein [Nocardia sp. NPDC004750]
MTGPGDQGIDVGASQAGELDNHAADRSGGADDQNALVGAQLRGAQGLQGGRPG